MNKTVHYQLDKGGFAVACYSKDPHVVRTRDEEEVTCKKCLFKLKTQE